MTIGERLKQQRQLRKFTQAELAKRAEVSQGLVARIETGKVKDPASSITLRLARALGVTADWLIGMYEEDDPSLLLAMALAP